MWIKGVRRKKKNKKYASCYFDNARSPFFKGSRMNECLGEWCRMVKIIICKTGDGLDFRIFRVKLNVKGSIILGALFRRTKGERG